jgi:hypothetical protein
MSRASNRTGSPKYSVASLRLAISATPAAPPAVPSSPAARAYSPKFSSASTLATSPRYSGPNVIYNVRGGWGCVAGGGGVGDRGGEGQEGGG